MTVKYHGDAKGIMTGINSLLTQLDPEYTFEYRSLEEAVAGLYEEEANLLRITGICGIIAIILSLSGVYAMAVYFAKRKTREYSIRKVFGASERNITALSVSQIMWPVVAGTLLPWPAAYVIAKNWLSHFSAKITIGVLPFIISMASVALLVLLTVFSVSRRSSLENPADILRQE
jgi:predicted lysophospholipase L1 biosynthesis ABC-type transport system permease subunit